MLRSLFLFGVGSLAVAAIAHAQEPGISETLARDPWSGSHREYLLGSTPALA